MTPSLTSGLRPKELVLLVTGRGWMSHWIPAPGIFCASSCWRDSLYEVNRLEYTDAGPFSKVYVVSAALNDELALVQIALIQ